MHLAEAQEPLTVPSHEIVDPQAILRWNRVSPGPLPEKIPFTTPTRSPWVTLLPFRDLPLHGRDDEMAQIWSRLVEF